MKQYLFTSESVSEGHPDKVADKISDAIVDAILAQDPRARIAAETLVTTGLCLLAGEITTTAQVNYAQVARNTIREIGYNFPDLGFDGNSISVQVAYGQQSPDIALGVNEGTGLDLEQGAGDQGIMFGYACNETPSYMPAPIYYAHRIMEQQALVRKTGKLSFLRPDAKSQVTFRYVDGEPVDIDTVVVSTQHSPEVDYDTLRDAVITEVILPVLPEKFITPATKFLINPTGRFVIGGPMGDSGLTGRKIIVDTYGGSAPHGGGAFSGKDPSKVDRSAAYALRYVAKNIVAGGFARKCQIQISYAIGVARPVSIMVDTFGTGVVSDEKLAQAVNTCFDLRPKGIIQMLDLLKPIYSPTASYGHFGREDQDFTWERIDKIEELRGVIGV